MARLRVFGDNFTRSTICIGNAYLNGHIFQVVASQTDKSHSDSFEGAARLPQYQSVCILNELSNYAVSNQELSWIESSIDCTISCLVSSSRYDSKLTTE